MRTIYKTIVLSAIVLAFCTAAFSQQVAKSFPYPASPDGLIGFLEFRPSDYGTQKHPLIIFLHGIGERGNGTTQIGTVANNAIPMYCANGGTMRFTVGGVTSSFVVLSPQLSVQLGYWPTYYVKELIKYAKANLSIDTNRIYVCGLSLGGGGIWRLLTDTQNFDHTFDGTIAAAAPVCGTQEETDADFCTTIGTNHLPVWAFHSMDDGTVNVGATQHAEILNNICGNFSPAIKFTYYQYGGHAGAWINAYDTGHITVPVVVNGVVSNFTATPNLYEWFLMHTRATAPVAVAGAAQFISTTSTVLNAAGSYSPNGSISSYSWQQVSGPMPATIVNANSAVPTVSNMIQGGDYGFKLTVTDVAGISGSALTDVNVLFSLLPVQLSYFKGQKAGNGNVLQWEASAVQNSDYFAVERSTDGNQFTTIGKVTQAGTAKDYSFTDVSAPASNVYYRLRQVDQNGTFKFSQLVLISAGSINVAVQMYPNPVHDNINIALNNDIKGKGIVTVYELTGRSLIQQTIEKSDKVLNAVVNMNNLSSGLYIVEVKIGDTYKFTERVMKK
ncbi:MAG: T9SS type A sorting domain-containing protein [Bacteroidota bacterium]